MIGIKVKNQLLAQNLISLYPTKLEIFNPNKTYTALISDKQELNANLPVLHINCPNTSLNINTPFSLTDFNNALTTLDHAPIELKFYWWHNNQRILEHKKTKKTFQLTQKEAELVDFLIHTPHHQADKKTILNTVWHYHTKAQTHTLGTHLYHLGQKLGKNHSPLIQFNNGLYHLL